MKEIEQRSYERKLKGLKISLSCHETMMRGKELHNSPYVFASFCPQGQSVPFVK